MDAGLTLVLALAALAAPQDAADRLERKVEECAKHVTERFVFFGGGSGVLVSAEGHCLTNHHVVAALKGAQPAMRVTLLSGKPYVAKLVCTDPIGDIALYRLQGAEGEKFPFVEFGDSDRLEPGRYVMACGNPFALAQPAEDGRTYPAVTLGIVSALHRNQNTYFDCIQTDAAVNPGNSGGPLVTLDGKLVGINGRIATRYFNRTNSGVGYAVPSNQIRNFLPLMMKGGDEGKAYHGQVTGLTLSRSNTDGRGARVEDVRSGSPADRAGFRRDDFIVRVEDYPIHNRDRFLGAVGTWPMGTEVRVRVRRGDEERELKATLDRYSAGDLFASGTPQPPQGPPAGAPYLGVTVEDAPGGVTATYVHPGSPAEKAGIQEGDVILRLDGRKVSDRADLTSRIWKKKPGDEAKISVRRNGEEIELDVRLGRPPRD
jgi:S1-C subfamily serine protease